MALSQVGSSLVAEAGTGTSLNLPVPASLATNDLVIAAVHLFGTAKTDTVVAPSGFTEIPECHVLQTAADVAVDQAQIRIFWKWFAGESGSYTFSWTNSSTNAAGCNVIRGAPYGYDPIDHAAIVAAQTTFVSTLPTASQTWSTCSSAGLSQSGEIVVAFLASDQGGQINTSGVFSKRQDEADLQVLDATFASAGQSSTTTIVMNLAADQIFVTAPVLAYANAPVTVHRMPLGA